MARLHRHRDALGDRLLARAVWSGKDDPRIVRDALAGLGFPKVSLGHASPPLFAKGSRQTPGWRDFSPLADLAGKEADTLLACVKARDGNRLRRSPLGTPIAILVQRLLNAEIRTFFCGRGQASLAVSGQGEFYPCHRFAGEIAFRLGDLRSGAKGREAYSASPVARLQPCVSCFAKYLCGGGCSHDHLGMTGADSEPAPDFCGLMRRQAEIAAAVSLEMNVDDQAWLVDQKIVAPKYCPLDF